ncbi:restriction endonuclease subunit S [Tannerella sp.]|uniref:restriction endonuclease subunit S n=1 Tax=Tannerella sp. TaxID=2382127 RepID=UPI0026DB6D3F|nr:restriction endonuclease subunit S [Tannerella sp.]MDO4704113.1 restriction endonuclease subunit S [Tannerella sp.]
MREWKEYRFSDFAEVNPSVKIPKDQLVSFVEMKDLTDGQRFCKPSQERILSGGSRFENGDTLFARITPCLENGKICQVKGLKNGIGFGSTEFHVLRGRSTVSDSDFVYYLCRWSDVRDHAEKNFDGTSGRQRVPKQAFDDLYLKLPELPEQQSIASILSSLDDKIDLLHRQNATLEKMAETLFRQWFVEEAKEDWEEISLYDAIELVGGGTPKTSVVEYWDGNIKWLSGGDIASNHKNFVVNSEKSITKLGLINSSAKLLPKFSTVISARGTVGKYCILSEPMAYSQSNYGILPKFKDCFFFSYLLVSHSVEELQSAAYGSVFDTITTNTFKGITISLPVKETIIQFNESIKPYFLKILSNQTQIRTLTALRDTLLLKLMSGEVRVEVE